jgi:hypothetical protein
MSDGAFRRWVAVGTDRRLSYLAKFEALVKTGLSRRTNVPEPAVGDSLRVEGIDIAVAESAVVCVGWSPCDVLHRAFRVLLLVASS